MLAKKVLLVGRFGVGKTSLIRRFVENEFSEDYISTIGVRVSAKTVQVDGKEVKLMIWDVAGTKDDEKVPKAYFLGAASAMYVFDLSIEDTYHNLAQQLESVRELSGLSKITVVGNKKDLLSEEKLDRVRATINHPVDLFTSAKENEQVEEAFKVLALQSLK
jgi:small GTP-binding protein